MPCHKKEQSGAFGGARRGGSRFDMLCGGELYGALRELAELIKSMTSSGELFIAPVMKCAAIAIVTKLASELCRDSSQSAVASSVELAGSICALSVAMPLIISMLKTIGAMA